MVIIFRVIAYFTLGTRVITMSPLITIKTRLLYQTEAAHTGTHNITACFGLTLFHF